MGIFTHALTYNLKVYPLMISCGSSLTSQTGTLLMLRWRFPQQKRMMLLHYTDFWITQVEPQLETLSSARLVYSLGGRSARRACTPLCGENVSELFLLLQKSLKTIIQIYHIKMILPPFYLKMEIPNLNYPKTYL